MDIREVLQQRGQRYGSFLQNANCAQELKMVMRVHCLTRPLSPDVQEALDMIAHKISRVLTGDPSYADNWVDIAGYATLIADRLALPDPATLPPAPSRPGLIQTGG